MDYALLKAVHQAAVTISVLSFAVRGAAALAGAGWVRHRVVKTLPHAVDTVLLLSALGLAWTLRAHPLATPWLAAKIAGLVAYVALGVLALRPGRPLAVRMAAYLAALAVVGWIVSVAITKNALGAFASLG
jgi:uncharacterized membrane protein SirB2